MAPLPFVYHDGGRRAAGRRGDTGDCVVRAIVIATGQDYSAVYDRLAAGNAHERVTKRTRGPRGRTASHGIHVTRKWFKDYMHGMGWTFVATMGIGTGCTVHLAVGELPMGRLIVHVSKCSSSAVRFSTPGLADQMNQTPFQRALSAAQKCQAPVYITQLGGPRTTVTIGTPDEWLYRVHPDGRVDTKGRPSPSNEPGTPGARAIDSAGGRCAPPGGDQGLHAGAPAGENDHG